MKASILLSLVACLGCACNQVLQDPSPLAIANDYTLVTSICEGLPSGGVSVCRTKDGSPISSQWTVILPKGKAIKGGECIAQYRDKSISFGIQEKQVMASVSLFELVGGPAWSKGDSGTAVMYCNLDIDTGQGIQIVKARGFAFFIVTDPAYDPLPLDSGFVASVTKCEIAYSTAGRSKVSCK